MQGNRWKQRSTHPYIKIKRQNLDNLRWWWIMFMLLDSHLSHRTRKQDREKESERQTLKAKQHPITIVQGAPLTCIPWPQMKSIYINCSFVAPLLFNQSLPSLSATSFSINFRHTASHKWQVKKNIYQCTNILKKNSSALASHTHPHVPQSSLSLCRSLPAWVVPSALLKPDTMWISVQSPA